MFSASTYLVMHPMMLSACFRCFSSRQQRVLFVHFPYVFVSYLRIDGLWCDGLMIQMGEESYKMEHSEYP